MEALLITILATSIPLLLAATGELVAERSGVLNLGVEGMMLIGAVSALAAVLYTGNPYSGIIAGALGGLMLSLVFAFFAITLMTNQVATGLALTIFATGFSGLAGAPLVGKTAESLPPLDLPVLSSLPFIGPVLFGHDLLFYLSFGLIGCVSFFSGAPVRAWCCGPSVITMTAPMRLATASVLCAGWRWVSAVSALAWAGHIFRLC